jgi:hypothetical protein
MRERLAVAAVALGLTLGLGACGSGEDSTSTPAPAVVKAEGAGPRVVPLKVSGGGSAQFRVKGADNSIANYGEEAPRRELRRAAAVVHGYFAALAREEWRAACARLAHKERSQVIKLASSHAKVKGCAPALAVLFGSVSAAEGREATAVDAAALRREGGQGFMLYRGAGGKPYFVSMRSQGGRWTVAGLSPVGLP